jgi:AP-3 complex subunit delta-1
MTSADTYVNITDFEWYMTVLVDLAYVSNVNVGEEIKERILDVTARVRGNFRPFVVQLMQRLLKDETFVANANEDGSCCEILYAASWVVGEYCQYVPSCGLVLLSSSTILRSLSSDSKKDMIDTLLNSALYQINNEISVVTLTAAVKVFAYFTAEAAEDWKLDLYNDAKDLVKKMTQTLSSCSSSPEVELQERVSDALLSRHPS